MTKGLRILFLNYEYPPLGGGGGTMNQVFAEKICARGHHVYIITGGVPGSIGIEKPYNRLTIERLYTTRKRVDVCTIPEMIIYICKATMIFRTRCRSFQPDIVHAFFSVPSGSVLWFHQQWLNIPYFVSLLGGDVPGLQPKETGRYHRIIAPLTIRLWRNAAGVLPNSQRLANLAGKTVDLSFQVIPNCVDTSFFGAEEREPTDLFTMLFVGRLVYQKGLDILLEALNRLKDRLKPWHLTIVGDGPLWKEYRRLARNLELEEHLHWLGWVSFEQLPKLYRQNDAFILPSRAEGMPSVLLQAMASGCVILTTKVFGVDEVVETGKNGFVIKTENSEALADRILELSAMDLKTMQEHSKKRASLFSCERATDRLENLYKKAVGNWHSFS